MSEADPIPPGALHISRFLPNGQFDTTFGSGGEVRVALGGPLKSDVYRSNVAIQPDGRIVAFFGSTYNQSVLRFLPDGSLDTSFGGDGKITFTDLYLGDLAAQPDGKIVLAGWLGQGLNADFAAARLNADGSFDNTFGINGISRTDFENQGSKALAVALQRDGKIVGLGSASNGNNNRVALARYNADGSLDTSFGNLGKVTTETATSDTRDIVVQQDNKLVVAGTASNNGLLMRFDANGSLDSSFGNAGIVSRPGLPLHALAVQSNGKIITGGASSAEEEFIHEHALARYLANGTPDTSFGENGTVHTAFSDQGNFSIGGEIRALSIQPDGKIIGAGDWEVASCGEQCASYGAYPAIARYLGDAPPPFDFDGDGRSDLSVFRPSDGVWYLGRSTEGFTAVRFGLSADKIVPADYDGDGKTDIAIYRDGTWWMMNSSNSTVEAVQFGLAGDVPVPADYTGDGRDELAIYRNGQWWMLNLANGQSSVIPFGVATDKPVVADYDGDRRADQAVYRNGEWHLNRSTGGYVVYQFGIPTDRPVVGDYDGDGRSDLAVYRDGMWYIDYSAHGPNAFLWGLATDIPAPADYDGDGKTDATVYRDGTWYILRSSGGIEYHQFGLSGDAPAPVAYNR